MLVKVLIISWMLFLLWLAMPFLRPLIRFVWKCRKVKIVSTFLITTTVLLAIASIANAGFAYLIGLFWIIGNLNKLEEEYFSKRLAFCLELCSWTSSWRHSGFWISHKMRVKYKLVAHLTR